MKKIIAAYLLTIVFLTVALLWSAPASAQQTHPDTVYTGCYITSIHDINFKDKEYTITMWLWLRYKNKAFDFAKNLEVPQAKSVSKDFTTVDSSNNRQFMLMKLQCVMKDTWATENFPFDKQKLRFSIENSQFDRNALIFVADTAGKHFDPKFVLRGWNIDSLGIITGIKTYETAFGDITLKKPHTEYSNYKVVLQIYRNAFGLFWKMFLGMYVAFLIAYICFYIHSDSIDSRFGLGVGALFAVVGNKYIIDASLPESTSFTLVDTLHGITLLFILIVITCNAYSLRLLKRKETDKAQRFDFICAQAVLAVYVLMNVWFVYQAVQG